MLTHFEWISCEYCFLYQKKNLSSIVSILRILSAVRTFQTFSDRSVYNKIIDDIGFILAHFNNTIYTYIITCNPKDINMCLDSNRTKIYYGHFFFWGGGRRILCRKCSKPSVIIKPVIQNCVYCLICKFFRRFSFLIFQ